MEKRIYLDNNASTPLDPKVVQAVIQSLHEYVGNPSSIHYFGQQTCKAITSARFCLADLLKVKPRELIFTSGGSEALNMVIRGVCTESPRGHIVTSDAEHSSVYNTITDLQKQGYEATFLSVGPWGAVAPEDVKAAIRPNTRLIALTAVNNETGVKSDIEQIAKIAVEANIPFLVDAVALLGKESFKIPLGVSAMCFSGHKIHAPKGIGLAFVRQSLKCAPLITGGSQEFGKRAGTENVSGIIGFVTAMQILKDEVSEASTKMLALRNRFEEGIKSHLQDVIINGQGPRICNVSNLAFPGIDGESLLMNLDTAGIAASHGSACVSGALEPSRVLLNMGIPLHLARSSLRFSFSRFNTFEEIAEAIAIIIKVVTCLYE